MVRRRTAILMTVLLTGLGVLAPSTAATAAESNGGTRILVLGDSITDGFNVPGGYRINLWRSLASAGHLVDFVGTGSNGPADLPDHDHEGHNGWRVDQIDAIAAGVLRDTSPRSILLHIGTNDVVQNYDMANAPARLSALVDHIRAAAPNADLFVSSIIPLSDPARESRAAAYNATIPAMVASKGSQVHYVDMHSALTTADLADGVHPTRGGYDKMAARWASALASVPGSAGTDGAGVTIPTGLRSVRVTTPGYTDRYARHQNSVGFTEHVDSGSSALLKADATWRVVPGLAGGCYSLESRNFPGYYLRHQNGRVRISTDDGSALTRSDATWCARSAPAGVRLSAWSYPGSYLRHVNSELWLATPGGSGPQDTAASLVADLGWSVDAPWAP
ncbi:AbfB domain-containing protein [Lentzea sp. NPDC059081]|uniref:AbfB domain-containing protein n=1 Tax=Lentzea sp. NPDC059081 TaxID=3346719 RepID=UPI00367B993E